MRATLIAPITVLVYALHQDFWFWRSARPLVFGFLPIGLFYHAVYTAAISLFMWYVVRRSWPSHLEDANERQPMSHASGARPIVRAEADGAEPPGNLEEAKERQRMSHASGAGISGVPASERAGGSGGAEPPS